MTEQIEKKVEELEIAEPKLAINELTHYHPLNTKWTLWYLKPFVDKTDSWGDLLKSVVTFSTVEEFWGIFNSIPSASELPIRSEYHLFREGIRPEWEDPNNANGGRFYYHFTDRKVPINEIWLRALLSAIGETIEEDENEVNGIVLNVRRAFYRVGLWTKSTNKASLEPVGLKFKKVLKLSESEKLEFSSHDDQKSTKITFSV